MINILLIVLGKIFMKLFTNIQQNGWSSQTIEYQGNMVISNQRQ
jgi:hypothetical protein